MDSNGYVTFDFKEYRNVSGSLFPFDQKPIFPTVRYSQNKLPSFRRPIAPKVQTLYAVNRSTWTNGCSEAHDIDMTPLWLAYPDTLTLHLTNPNSYAET